MFRFNHTLNQVSENIISLKKLDMLAEMSLTIFENLEKKKKNNTLSLPHLYEHKFLTGKLILNSSTSFKRPLK